MRKFATRLLPLAMYAALVVVPTIALAEATTDNREEKSQERIQKSGQTRPVTRPSSQAGCAGGARSFDCKQWPPSMDDDPDRKAGSGGGM
jgi:hypothetical protein